MDSIIQSASSSSCLRSTILSEVEAFPDMPVLIGRVLEVMNDPQADIDEIVRPLKLDPGMTANILKLANSAQFGNPQSVVSISEAIIRLGLKRIFELMVVSGVSTRLCSPLAGYNLSTKELLNHSVFVAIAAEEICLELDLKCPDMLFTAGLLHDIGKIVLNKFVLSKADALEDAVRSRGLSYPDAEADVLGINHAEVGALLLKRWSFPASLVETTHWHHQPIRSSAHRDVISVVHLAEILAYAEGIGAGADGLMCVPCEETIEGLGVKGVLMEKVALKTLTRFSSVQELLEF